MANVHKLLIVSLATLVLCECLITAIAADDNQVSPTSSSKSKKTSKSTKRGEPQVRRTIRMKEIEPLVEETTAAVQPQTIDLSNVGPSNQVDVKPSISINNPSEVQQDKSREPAVNELERENRFNIVHYVAPEQVAPVSNFVEPQAMQALASANQNKHHSLQLSNNSDNSELNLVHGSNNQRKVLLTNSGSVDELHLDGVGNKKVTKISNVGNTEHEEVANVSNAQQQLSRSAPARPETVNPLEQQQVPLVQINMAEHAQPVFEQPLPRAPFWPYARATAPMAPVLNSVQQQQPLALSQLNANHQLLLQQMMRPEAGQLPWAMQASWPSWPWAAQAAMPAIGPTIVQVPAAVAGADERAEIKALNRAQSKTRRQVVALERQVAALRKAVKRLEDVKAVPTQPVVVVHKREPSTEVVVEKREPEAKKDEPPHVVVVEKPVTTSTETPPPPPTEETEWKMIRVPKTTNIKGA